MGTIEELKGGGKRLLFVGCWEWVKVTCGVVGENEAEGQW